MNRFIAIDPSSTFTGWAVFEDEGLVAWGNIDARKSNYAGRFEFIIDEMTSACLKYGAQSVAIEDVKFAWHGKNRNRNIAGLQVVFRSIQEWAKELSLDFTAYNPASWKNAVVGHVHASKETTRANMCLRFQNLPVDLSEHVYDAVGIGVYHFGMLKLRAMSDDPLMTEARGLTKRVKN